MIREILGNEINESVKGGVFTPIEEEFFSIYKKPDKKFIEKVKITYKNDHYDYLDDLELENLKRVRAWGSVSNGIMFSIEMEASEIPGKIYVLIRPGYKQIRILVEDKFHKFNWNLFYKLGVLYK